MIRETIDTSAMPPSSLLRNFSCRSAFARCFPWLVLSLSLGGCGLLDERSIKWTEDAKLTDGRVVTLTRYQEFRDADYDPGNYWFEFKHPDSGQIVHWESDRDLAPLVLLIHKGDVLLIVSPKWGSSVMRYKCPDPPYLLYRYDSQVWQQVSLADVPIKELRANVIYSVYDYVGEIKKRRNHLPIEVTQSQTRDRKQWIIDFRLMKEQTFGGSNCGRSSNYLIAQ